MKVWERIESLRKRMREEDIDVYPSLIHISEPTRPY